MSDTAERCGRAHNGAQCLYSRLACQQAPSHFAIDDKGNAITWQVHSPAEAYQVVMGEALRAHWAKRQREMEDNSR